MDTLNSFKPDIVLTDLEMPNMNGIELTSHIRGREDLKGLSVIMIASRSQEKHRRMAEQAGVDTYFTKPYNGHRVAAHDSRVARGLNGLETRTDERHPNPSALRGNFVLLKADGLQLLLPQQDVGAAEYLDSAPLSHGAIALPVTPGSVQVSDAALCPLPDTSDLWPLVALSCFEIEGRAVPILDTSRLFGLYHG